MKMPWLEAQAGLYSRQQLLLDLALGAIALAALVFAAVSLAWPIGHDSAILLYEGFLMMDAGLVPYRDFFEINAPGTMLLYSALHSLTGGAALGLRIVDLLVLALIGLSSAVALRGHGWRTGLLAAASFACFYQWTGLENAMQREYLCVLPLAASVALIFRRGARPRAGRWQFFACGLLAGATFTVKPPIVICWLPLAAYAAVHIWLEKDPGQRRSELAKLAGLLTAGGLLPVAAVAAWLYRTGALGPFLEVVSSYYPLYVQIDPTIEIRPASFGLTLDRYLVRTLPVLGGHFGLAAFLGIAAGWSLSERRLKAQNAAIAGLILCAVLYVPLSGKFWIYHRIPLFYAFALATAMTLSRGLPRPFAASTGKAVTLALALAAAVPVAATAFVQLGFKRPTAAEEAATTAGQLAAYLREHTSAADTIMPLETVSEGIHALYKVRRPMYSRFVYDFHFYHHAEELYIRDLRRRFLEQFSEGRPSVILQCHSYRPRGLGSAPFPELDAILAERYRPALIVKNCAVLRRREG